MTKTACCKGVSDAGVHLRSPHCHSGVIGGVDELLHACGRALCVAVVIVCGMRCLSAQTAEGHHLSVRSHDARLAALLKDGRERSATFQRLVDQITKDKGIVYIDEGKCGYLANARACLLLQVNRAGDYRLLYIRVRQADQQPNDLLAAIAHELQHAVEVLGNREANSMAAMYLFYHREGLRTKGFFETNSAITTGQRVLRELQQTLSGNLPLEASRRPDASVLRPSRARGRCTQSVRSASQVPRSPGAVLSRPSASSQERRSA
jgi:hypothetical protein